MKRLKHSKFKNTGLIFEIMLRRAVTEMVRGIDPSPAKRIVETALRTHPELQKEYFLYKALVDAKDLSQDDAKALLEMAIESRRRLDESALAKQKYALIGVIREAYDIDDLFSTRVDNYKLIASVYKIFEGALNMGTMYDPKDVLGARRTLLESAQSAPEQPVDLDPDLKEYLAEDEDIKILAFERMVRRFNKTFEGLNENQRELVRGYMSSIDNDSLRSLVKEHGERSVGLIMERLDRIDDIPTKAKVQEVVRQVATLSTHSVPNDKHLQTVMLAYSLSDEIDAALQR